MTIPDNTRSTAIGRHTLVRCLLACALLIGLAYFPLHSTAAPTFNTWYVAITGDDARDCKSPANACRNIKTAMSRALPGDLISIGAGTYFENLDVLFDLTLQGAGSGVTFIDGGDLNSTVSIELTGSTTPTNLANLTIQNGQAPFGGGLNVNAGQVNLTNVNVLNNHSSQGGAGIFNQGSMNLTNVVIDNNQNTGSDRGGGLLNLAQINLVNVTVSNNTAGFGGGIGNRGTMTITASVIDHNLNASQGGGIANSLNGRLTLVNTTISNHPTGGGLHNTDNGVVIIAGGVITNNWSDTSGGGIYNLGQLTLNSVALHNNRALFGGGLYNQGSAALTNVTLQGNRTSGGNGGGLHGSGGSLTLNNSLVLGNQTTSGNGGGLSVSAGSVSVANTQIMSNTTDSLGGGLYNATATTLTNVDLIGNTASNGGGGIFNAGANSHLVYLGGTLHGNRAATGNGGGVNNTAYVDLRNLTIRDNQASSGGGVFNDGLAIVAADIFANNLAANGGGLYNGTTGQLTITDNSLYDNSAQQFTGGGIDNRGQLLLGTSSIYSNTAGTQGGSGLYNAGQARVVNSTLSYNRVLTPTNDGALLNNGGALLITNTTISANYGPNIVRVSGLVTITNSLVGAPVAGGNNCVGALTSLGYNLESGTSCGLGASGDISNTNPLLGPLQNNGGATLTRGLLTNSRALDAAGNSACPATDQRGISRPQGAGCDIGAYEIIGYSSSVTQTVGGPGCITSTVSISNSYLAGDMLVGVNLTFAPRGDLRVTLYAPHNTQVNLLGNTGGNGQNLDVLWSQTSAAGPVGTENHNTTFPYYKYERAPDHSLAPLFGRSLYGDWRLEICNVGVNTGTLNRWALIVPSFSNPKVFLPLVRR